MVCIRQLVLFRLFRFWRPKQVNGYKILQRIATIHCIQSVRRIILHKTILNLSFGPVMNSSHVAEAEELSEPEFTHQAHTARISTGFYLFIYF